MNNSQIVAKFRPEQTRRGDQALLPTPAYRRLRGYAFDPSLSAQLENRGINEVTYKVYWEAPESFANGDSADAPYAPMEIGPVGEYVEVVDVDPASDMVYPPVDLNHPLLLAQDGLPPSEGNPQFHQQMVYAVAMTTIANFEQALGRPAQWRSLRADEGQTIQSKDFEAHDDRLLDPQGQDWSKEKFVRRLRIYPHALRQANAFYSPDKRAILFGYFAAESSVSGRAMPGGTVFTCLSHDVIAHETTHALLDGMHGSFIEPTQPDSLAFHEAFADIVALFQHFSFAQVVHGQISRTRGDLESQNLLGQLAQEVGTAIGNYGALRDAIGEIDKQTGEWRLSKPDPLRLSMALEPHERGSILVASVFDAFLSIYKARVADLLRIASSGTGILPAGDLHPDLVNRLATEAAKSAEHVLHICVRALDYCPPVDISFGDYLRALITADRDLAPADERGYRVAFLEAFKRRGIYPRDVRTLSVESLSLHLVPKGSALATAFQPIQGELKRFQNTMRDFTSREQAFHAMRDGRYELHRYLTDKFQKDHPNECAELEKKTGLVMSSTEAFPASMREAGLVLRTNDRGKPSFEVHALRTACRVGLDGRVDNHLIFSIIQSAKVGDEDRRFRGGCTFILDLATMTLLYIIPKRLDDLARWQRQQAFWNGALSVSQRAMYFGNPYAQDMHEPFSLLHDDR